MYNALIPNKRFSNYKFTSNKKKLLLDNFSMLKG